MIEPRMSRDNQKLIYWLIDDYARHQYQAGENVGVYDTYKAKQELKKLFIKHKGINIKKLKPFEKLKKFLYEVIDSDKETEEKVGEIITYILSEFQRLTLQLDGTFSLTLKLMSNKAAMEFTTYLFDYFLDNEIPFKDQISQLYAEQQNEKYVFSMMRKKKCAVCGAYGDLDHYDSVNSIGGYKFDDGLQTRFICLCRVHHEERHRIENIEFENKYKLKGVWLDAKKVKLLKKVFPNHFKNFKGE